MASYKKGNISCNLIVIYFKILSSQMRLEKRFSMAFYQNSEVKDLSHSGEVKGGITFFKPYQMFFIFIISVNLYSNLLKLCTKFRGYLCTYAVCVSVCVHKSIFSEQGTAVSPRSLFACPLSIPK